MLAEIFANFLGFLLGFLKDFIGNLQRDLCELFSLDFCFCFDWVDIDGRIMNYGNYRMIFMYS